MNRPAVHFVDDHDDSEISALCGGFPEPAPGPGTLADQIADVTCGRCRAAYAARVLGAWMRLERLRAVPPCLN